MSDVQWYYAKGGRQEGPVMPEVLEGMIARGEVSGSDLVWAQGMPQWIEAQKVPALSGGRAGVAPVIAYHAAVEPEGRYGGFWLRLAAYIIDYAILTVAGIGCMMAAMGVMMAMSRDWQNAPAISLAADGVIWVAAWLYFALMESSRKQATVGKMALGLKVMDLEGRAIGFGRASGRFFGKIISGWILMIGFMMAGWTKRKQALHDMMAGTLVVRR